MVGGLETFRAYFEGDDDKYVLIGGTACDMERLREIFLETSYEL